MAIQSLNARYNHVLEHRSVAVIYGSPKTLDHPHSLQEYPNTQIRTPSQAQITMVGQFRVSHLECCCLPVFLVPRVDFLLSLYVENTMQSSLQCSSCSRPVGSPASIIDDSYFLRGKPAFLLQHLDLEGCPLSAVEKRFMRSGMFCRLPQNTSAKCRHMDS